MTKTLGNLVSGDSYPLHDKKRGTKAKDFWRQHVTGRGECLLCIGFYCTRLLAKITDIPFQMGEKTFVINRVAAKVCAKCGSVYPTKAGQVKIECLMGSMAHLGFFSVGTHK